MYVTLKLFPFYSVAELERGLTEEQIRIVCKQMFEVINMLLLYSLQSGQFNPTL